MSQTRQSTAIYILPSASEELLPRPWRSALALLAKGATLLLEGEEELARWRELSAQLVKGGQQQAGQEDRLLLAGGHEADLLLAAPDSRLEAVPSERWTQAPVAVELEPNGPPVETPALAEQGVCGLLAVSTGESLELVELLPAPGSDPVAMEQVAIVLDGLGISFLRSLAHLPGGACERIRVPVEQEAWRILRESGIAPATLDRLACEALGTAQGPLARLEADGSERRETLWRELAAASLYDDRFRYNGEALPEAGQGPLHGLDEEPELIDAAGRNREPKKVLVVGSPGLVKAWSEHIYRSAGAAVAVEGWQLWDLSSMVEEDYKAITQRGPYDLVLELLLGPAEERQQLIDLLLGLVEARGQLWVHTLSLPATVTVQVVPEDICAVGFGGLPPSTGDGRSVELSRPRNSDLSDLLQAAGMARKLGLSPMEVADEPGGVGARLLAMGINQATWLLREGLLEAAVEVDRASRLLLGLERGLLTLADEIGLDTVEAVLVGMQAFTGEQRYRVCPLLTMRIEAGLVGRSTGRGFFLP